MSNRRRFLQQALTGALTLGGMAGVGPGARQALAAPLKRRHLVNIVARWGWDSYWFHNGFHSSNLTSYQGDPSFQNDIQLSTSFNGFSALSSDQGKAYKLTLRFNDNVYGKMHPTAPGHFLGLGMTTIFKDADYGDMLIWKGLQQEGQHTVGNGVIAHGTGSEYAIPFSGLVAEGLAGDYLRPLHYVMATASPAELAMNNAMNRGNQVPICMDQWADFTKLTQNDPNDLEAVNRRDALNAAIAKISGEIMASKLLLKTSQQIAMSFAGSFGGAIQVAGSQFATSPEFKYCWKRMILGMMDRVLALYSNADFATASATKEGITDPLYVSPTTLRAQRGSLSPLPDMTTYLAAKAQLARNPTDATLKAQVATLAAALDPNLMDAINLSDRTYGQWAKTIIGMAYKFALADYLVSQDLSAVVDIPAFLPDAHGNNIGGMLVTSIVMAGFQLLMESFRGQILPDGTTLLSKTLLLMHTELDREPFFTTADPGGSPTNAGTNHGYTTSALLAGYGIVGGRVVGDIHHGPKDIGRFGLPNQASPSVKYATPLPIDVNTGQPKSLPEGGRVISTKAIFPTILAIFGVPIPATQITDFSAIPAVFRA